MAAFFVEEGESIQAAIDAAAAGDTIIVGPGTYNESLNINKDVTVISLDGADETIINGQGTNPGFSFAVQITAAGATFGDANHGFTVNAGAQETAAVSVGAVSGIHIEDNVINGNDGAAHLRQGLVAFGGVSNLTIQGNSFGGGATQLIYVNGTPSTGVASTNVDLIDNTFTGNAAVGVVLESDGGQVSGNTFGGGLNTGLSLPVAGNVVTDNDFTGLGTGLDLVVAESFDMTTNPTAEKLSASHATAGVVVTGNDLDNTIRGANTFDDDLSGGIGNDTLEGRSGDDTLDGGVGDDALFGNSTATPAGAGTDTARYFQAIDASMVSANGGGWTVTTGGVEGTDSLTDVEIIDGAGADVLLVGNGGFTNIREAIDAASAGDAILIAPGTFDLGDGAPPDQATFSAVPDNVTVIGAGEGITIVTGNPRIAAMNRDFGGPNAPDGLTLKDMTLQYDGDNGFILQWGPGNGGVDLTLENVTLTGTHEGNAGSGTLADVRNADGLTLTNVTYDVTTAGGDGTRFLFGSGDNIAITGGQYNGVGGSTVINLFDSANTNVTGATFSDSDFFLQNANAGGATRSSFEGNTFEGGGHLAINQSSHVDVDNGNVFTVEGDGQGILFTNQDFGGSDSSDIIVTGNMFQAGATATGNASAMTFVGGTLGLPEVNPVTFTGNTETGLSLTFKVLGGDPSENLTDYASAGNDFISGGTGDDILAGGAGNDILDGGEGNDTAVFAGNFDDYSISSGSITVTDNNPGDGDDGTDTLDNVDALEFADTTVFIVDAASAAGGFTTIQAAIDAASAGDIILVAAGTYNESINIDKSLTILSADGAATTIINGQGTNPNFSFSVAINADNVIFGDAAQGFTVNAGASETAAVFLGSHSGVQIEGNTINGNATASHLRQGMLVSGGVANITVEGNTFGGEASQLVYVNGALNVGLASTNVDFTNNQFTGTAEGSSATPEADGSLLVLDADGSTLSGNTFSGAAGAAVVLQQPGNTVETTNVFSGFGGGTDIVTADTVFSLAPFADAQNLAAEFAATGVNFTGNGLDNTITGNQTFVPTFSDDFDDTLNGGAGNDSLVGLGGDDRLDGGAGDDGMTGGLGDDSYVVDSGFDTVTEAGGEGHDTVETTLGAYTLADNVEDLTFTGVGDFSGIGNELDNVITGSTGNDNLRGVQGNDTLRGGAGDDFLNGGFGTDTMEGGSDNDSYVVTSLTGVVVELPGGGTDNVRSGNLDLDLGSANYDEVENAILFGVADLDLTGDAGNNLLVGNDGDNRITGGEGADVMIGRAGADVFDFNDTTEMPAGPRDRIKDFTQFEDLIDFFGIDARESSPVINNAFTWIDTAAFTAEGQLRYFNTATATIIQGNTSGTSDAEFTLVLAGVHTLNDGDFVL